MVESAVVYDMDNEEERKEFFTALRENIDLRTYLIQTLEESGQLKR